jgi:MinD superfamily P-loop ATPase
MMPEIDIARCNGCGLCVSVCLRHCLVIVEGRIVVVEGIECDWCTKCEAVCASDAISCPYEIVIEQV